MILEKIRNHPGFKNVPAEQVSAARKNMKIVLERAEKIKQILLQKFQAEHDSYLQEKVLLFTIRILCVQKGKKPFYWPG